MHNNGIEWKSGRLEMWNEDAYLKQYPVEYLIEGVLPKRSHALLYAPTGHLKTFVAIHLASCVATGTPFNHRSVDQGEVVYIAAEAPSETFKRLRAWRSKHGYAQAVVTTTPTALNFKESADIALLGEYLRSREGKVKLVIFDTASRCASGIDESSNTEVGLYITKNVTGLIEEFGVSVLLVHHTGHDEQGARGARQWIDPCDTVLKVSTHFEIKSQRKNPKAVTLITEKLRSGSPLSLAFRPVDFAGSLVLENCTIEETNELKPKAGRKSRNELAPSRLDGTPRQRGNNPRRDTRAAILRVLEQGPTSVIELANSIEAPEKTVRNNLTNLKDQGKVTNENGSWQIAA